MATKTKKTSSMIPDWSLLPEELLHLISEKLEDCFDVVHARSVCSSWRSAFPFPSRLLRQTYSLPSVPYGNGGLCTLEKFSLFLFRVHTLPVSAVSPSELFLGGIGRDNKSEDRTELPSPVQCSVKVKIPGSEPTLMNMLDCQILPLGHHYRMTGWDLESYGGVAFLPLNKEGGGGFVVIQNYFDVLLVLTSAEMRWRLLKNVPNECTNLVAFRGRFYAVFLNMDIFVINPSSLEVNLLMPSPPLGSRNYLVPSGDDELFLVQLIVPLYGVINPSQLTCRVSRLDEEAGKWAVVSDLGDRVLFIGKSGNVSCSAKELPHGCGVSGNSILITDEPGNVTFFYKYVSTEEYLEGYLLEGCWRFSRENRVRFFNSSSVLALLVEC